MRGNLRPPNMAVEYLAELVVQADNAVAVGSVTK